MVDGLPHNITLPMWVSPAIYHFMLTPQQAVGLLHTLCVRYGLPMPVLRFLHRPIVLDRFIMGAKESR